MTSRSHGASLSPRRPHHKRRSLRRAGGTVAWCYQLSLGFCLILSGIRTHDAAADDWPRWRGPNLNGVSDEKDWTTTWPQEGPRQLWKAAVGIGFSSAAVAQGRLFTLGNTNETDTLFCLDAETGKELWRHSYACPLDLNYNEGGPGSTPTVDGDRVYTLSKRGHLFCLATASGNVLWQKNLMEELGVAKPRWGFAGSPLVQEDLLVLNVGGAGTGVAKTTGRVVWTSKTNTAGYATPVPFAFGVERCVAIFSAKELAGVQVKNGEVLWRFPWVTKWDLNIATPIVVRDRLFISTFDRGCALLQLGAAEPKVVWANKSMANHFNSCVYLDGYLYGIDGNTDAPPKDLRCVEVATGEVKWRQTGFGMGSLMVADGKLIVLGDKGELAVAEAAPTGFKTFARAQVLGGKCWTTPVLANGRIYCRNAPGLLVCVDVRAAEVR